MNKQILIFMLLALWAGSAAGQQQDPDIEKREREVMDEIFRTSDQPGEVPVARGAREQHRKRVSVPAGAFRVGCVCMDDTRSDTRSTGACSGHGGVRFWVYQTVSGDTVQVLTARHERHPHALTAAERSSITQKMVEKTQRLRAGTAPVNAVQPSVVVLPPTVGNGGGTWSDGSLNINDALFWAIAVVGAYFGLRLVLGWIGQNPELVKYALRNLLRSGKRPETRLRRKNIGKTRLSARSKIGLRGPGDGETGLNSTAERPETGLDEGG